MRWKQWFSPKKKLTGPLALQWCVRAGVAVSARRLKTSGGRPMCRNHLVCAYAILRRVKSRYNGSPLLTNNHRPSCFFCSFFSQLKECVIWSHLFCLGFLSVRLSAIHRALSSRLFQYPMPCSHTRFFFFPPFMPIPLPTTSRSNSNPSNLSILFFFVSYYFFHSVCRARTCTRQRPT